MKPITVDTALALMNAYISFSTGKAGKYSTEEDGVRYTLISEQNQLNNGPIVKFRVEEFVGSRWVDRMLIPSVNCVYVTDSLVVQSEQMFIRILFKSDDLPDGHYVVTPMKPVTITPIVLDDMVARFT